MSEPDSEKTYDSMAFRYSRRPHTEVEDDEACISGEVEVKRWQDDGHVYYAIYNERHGIRDVQVVDLEPDVAVDVARAILELAGEGGDQKPPKLMNGLEVLEALGSRGPGSFKWLQQKTKSGEIPCVKIGKTYRYSLAAVESAILKMADGETA
jgi:hypothetical protein